MRKPPIVQLLRRFSGVGAAAALCKSEGGGRLPASEIGLVDFSRAKLHTSRSFSFIKTISKAHFYQIALI